MTIKQGTLVKAWDDDSRDYVVGFLIRISSIAYPYAVGKDVYKNAIEIPPELAKALEELKWLQKQFIAAWNVQ